MAPSQPGRPLVLQCVLLPLALLASAAFDVVISDWYYQLATETQRYLALLAVGFGVLVLCSSAAAVRRSHRLRGWLACTGFGLAFVGWCWLVLLPRTPLWHLAGPSALCLATAM